MATEGFTIYFNCDGIRLINDAHALSARLEFVQFKGSRKPTLSEINEAFKTKCPDLTNLDITVYPEDCLKWKYDADPRVRVKFRYQSVLNDGEFHEDWEWDDEERECVIYEKTYLALLQGGKPAIKAYIEGKTPRYMVRDCRMRRL